MLFCVARDDVRRFAPADEIDPVYAAALRRVVSKGVEAYAYTTRVEPRRLELGQALPIVL